MAILPSTLERVDRGKMNLQLIANEENQIAPSLEKMRPLDDIVALSGAKTCG